MANHPVKNYSSSSLAASVLNGNAGSLQTLLRACLATGYGSMGVQALVITDGIATATYPTAHPYARDLVLRVAGAGLAAANGEQRVLTTTTNAVTFAVPGAPDGPVSGSITTDIAPAGWTELYPGAANMLALQSSMPEATGCALRIDDTGTKNARVRAYESMTDIGTGVGATPLDSQVSGGLWWPKSTSTNATSRPWFMVADARGFYLAVSPETAGLYTLVYAGDIASFKSGDPYGFLVTGNLGDRTAGSSIPEGCCGYSARNNRDGAYLMRAHTGLGQPVLAQRVGAHHNGTAANLYAGRSGYSWGAYPNGPNNGLLTCPLELVSQGLRGTLPGLLHPIQDLGAAFETGAIIDGTDDLAGRRLMAIRTAPPNDASSAGTVFVDLTGPWNR